jgi:hypothetical protein
MPSHRPAALGIERLPASGKREVKGGARRPDPFAMSGSSRRTTRSAIACTLAVSALLAGGRAALAQGEVCETPPSRGPISIIVLQSGDRVHELAGSVARGASIVAKDASTVIFDDGRVITADVEAAGRHLNALGWGARRIHFVASFPKRAARPRRSFG